MLRDQPRPFPRWHQDEIIELSRIAFRFKEKQSPSSFVSNLAEKVERPFPRDKVLSGTSVTEEWDEDGARDLLENHLTVSTGRVMVMSREGWTKALLVGEEGDPSEAAEHRLWSNERWYGTEYLTRKLSEAIIKQVGRVSHLDATDQLMISANKGKGPNTLPELSLPGRNAFIPRNIEVEKKEIDQVRSKVAYLRPMTELIDTCQNSL